MPMNVRNPLRSGFSARQERFIAEYLKDGNGTQAAIRAGYAKKSASVHATRLLAKDKILDKIRAGQNRILKRAEVSVERVLRELACLAFLDPAGLFDEKGELRPISEMPEEVRRALTGLEVEELFDFKNGRRSRTGNLRKIKFAQKTTALELLAKHLGILKDKVELTGKDGAPLSILQVRDALLRSEGDSGDENG